MELFIDGIVKAWQLLTSLDREVLSVTLLSLKVSGLATLISLVLGLGGGTAIALAEFPGKRVIVSVVNTGMGLPPVVVGLIVYLILSRRGPLGFLGLLYSPTAMIIAQTILAVPIVTALCHSAIVNVDPLIRQAARTLGATPRQETLAVIHEARYGILSAVIAAFGRVMAEVGSILIVGGNIAGYTRVMTTTIALETDKGNFELALALGIILLSISFLINAVLHHVQKRGAARTL